MHGSCFVGRWAFTTLASWAWLFVGSARRDAEAQMRWALLLIFAFDIASALSGFLAQLRRRGLRKALRQVGWYPASHIREHMPTQSRRS
jgi:hypothetical protein